MAATPDGTSHQTQTRPRTVAMRIGLTGAQTAAMRVRQRQLLNANPRQLANKHQREKQRREWQKTELFHLRTLTQQQAPTIKSLQEQIKQSSITAKVCLHC